MSLSLRKKIYMWGNCSNYSQDIMSTIRCMRVDYLSDVFVVWH